MTVGYSGVCLAPHEISYMLYVFFFQNNCTFNNKKLTSNTSLKCCVSQWLLLLSSRMSSEKGIFVSALIGMSRSKIKVYLLSKNLERKKLPFFWSLFALIKIITKKGNWLPKNASNLTELETKTCGLSFACNCSLIIVSTFVEKTFLWGTSWFFFNKWDENSLFKLALIFN